MAAVASFHKKASKTPSFQNGCCKDDQTFYGKGQTLAPHHFKLLYLISKSVHVIGRNRVMWRSIYLASSLASSLARQYCPH